MSSTQKTAGDGRVLAALDLSQYTPSVARYAAWSAARLQVPLELVHVCDPRGDWADPVLFDEEVQAATTNTLQARSQQGRDTGWLERISQRLSDEFPITPEHCVREGGSLVKALTADEERVGLFVLGKRGEYADIDTDHLGSQLERVVRSVRRPLLVASRQFNTPQRVMVAFDGSATTRKGIEMVASSPLFDGMDVTVLMAGNPGSAAEQQLEWALERLQAGGRKVRGMIKRGAADATILREAETEGADLLVMGAYGHSRIRQLIVGSTTTHVLRTSRVPVLLVR